MTAKSLPTTLIILISILFATSAQATNYATIAPGTWNNPSIWDCACVPPTFTAGLGDTINLYHDVTMSSDVMVTVPDRINVHVGASLNGNGAGANRLFVNSDGGQLNYGGFNIWGTVTVDYVRNVNASWIFIEPEGRLNCNGRFDNAGDIYISGVLEVNNDNFNHNGNDVWIFNGGDLIINNGDFNNNSTIRNLFPASCIRILGGNFNNNAGGEVVGNGGVNADQNIDNSANPITNWQNATWCAGGSGINLDPGLEDCAGPCNGPLQVELLSFDALLQTNGTVDVQWITTSQTNSDYFVVERSSDAKEFAAIGTEQAAGTNETTLKYSLIDEQPYEGVTYYRLVEVDDQGSKTYSNVVSVFAEPAELDFVVFPNPAADQFNVMVDASEVGAATLKLFDQTGAEVLVQDITRAQQSFALNDLPTGMYFVTLINGTQMKTHKLLVQ